MATYNFNVTASSITQPANINAGVSTDYVLENSSTVTSYFTLETVPNAQGEYDSTSPKNTSGSFTLSAGLTTLIQNDYFTSVIVYPGGGTLTFVPAVNIVASTLKLRGVGP